MKKTAKERLSAALEKLLQTKPLDDVTVSEIVSSAGLCRKTFYRHFKDKYDLAGYCFSQFFEESFGRITRGEDFDTALLLYLDICEEKGAVMKNAYSSTDINGIYFYDIAMTRRTFEKYLLAKGANIHTPEMQFAIEIASRGGADMVVKWVMGGMAENKVRLKDLIKRTLPLDLLQYLQ